MTDSEFIGAGVAIGTLAYAAVMFFFVRWWMKKQKKNRRTNKR